MINIPTGFSGFTIDVFNGSTSDSEGDVTKAIFAIMFQERVNEVEFTITDGEDHWTALMPSGEYIGLINPNVLFVDKQSAIVEFDMKEKHPSNTMAMLCQSNLDAEYRIRETDEGSKPFIPNTIMPFMGFTSNEYGGYTNDEGEVARVVFNITFALRKNDVNFEITDDDDAWAMIMGDGSYINLINPNVLFFNRDSATIVFQMESEYPSNSPGFLVKRKEEANYVITEIDDDYPFIPIQQMVFPDYIPAGERINLNSKVIVYPMNSTLRNLEWSLKSAGGTDGSVENGWISTVNAGDITLHVEVENGVENGVDYIQDIDVHVIDNWITIDQQPSILTTCISGNIHEELSVSSSTQFGELTYQWYKGVSHTNTLGTPIANATDPIFKIPKSLIPGDYFYYCEIRKVNFPSKRTDVCKVRVRDTLVGVSIYPETASIPPNRTQQFAIDKNPETCDENVPTFWKSSDASILTIDNNGVARFGRSGRVTITASVGDVSNSVEVVCDFIPVQSINWTLPTTIDTDTDYKLPQSVNPINASNQNIDWSILSPGTSGGFISNGFLRASNMGTITLRATIVDGLNPGSEYSQEFTIGVKRAHVPVTDVLVNNITNPRVGDLIVLGGTIVPSSASATNIDWSISNPGTTGATISNGVLTTRTAGTLTLLATVRDGIAPGTAFTKPYQISVRNTFIPVQYISGIPSEISYSEGQLGYNFSGVVVPSNAENKTITYSISPNDNSGLSPRIVNGKMLFDATAMTPESNKSITVLITVRNGLGDGIDFNIDAPIHIKNPAGQYEFTKVNKCNIKTPSVLRAYRPIILDKSEIVPWDATNQMKLYETENNKLLTDSSAIQFIPSSDNHDFLVSNGILFQEEFDWTLPCNYVYPFSKGTLNINLKIPDGLGINKDYTQRDTLEILDPFIAVKAIGNIPTKIYKGTKFYLSPEIDTGDGVDDETAMWDDRVSTFHDFTYEITAGETYATIDENGVITPLKTGTITVKITVPKGIQEEYTWYDKQFNQIDFISSRNIRILAAEESTDCILKIKSNAIKDSEDDTATTVGTIKIFTEAEFDILRAIRPADEEFEIGGKFIKRSSITEVEFTNHFNLADLSNFGRNFTSLVKINMIPETATNLRNFLMGCTKFNQSLAIPPKVSGDRCLEGFLRDCTSFNQNVVIPSTITGVKCMESFMRGCSKFNKNITFPETVVGDYAMYSAMMDCTSFNSYITFPTSITGVRCMENVLRNCTSYNKPIKLPATISGKYNIAAFMFECRSFTSGVIVPNAAVGSNVYHDVITLSTFHRNSNIDTNGVNISGTGADNFIAKVGNQGNADFIPLRTLKKSSTMPTIPTQKAYIDLKVRNIVSINGEYPDWAVNEVITYKITVMNNSEAAINDVVVTDVIPNEILYSSVKVNKAVKLTKTVVRDEASSDKVVSLTANTLDKNTDNAVCSKLKFTITKLARGEHVVITLTCKALTAAASVVNAVTSTFTEIDDQAIENDNNSSSTIKIIAEREVTEASK